MNQKEQSQVCSQMGRGKDEKRVGVIRDKNGDVYLFAPEGYILTFQHNDFKLYKVVPAKI